MRESVPIQILAPSILHPMILGHLFQNIEPRTYEGPLLTGYRQKRSFYYEVNHYQRSESH